MDLAFLLDYYVKPIYLYTLFLYNEYIVIFSYTIELKGSLDQTSFIYTFISTGPRRSK